MGELSADSHKSLPEEIAWSVLTSARPARTLLAMLTKVGEEVELVEIQT